MAKANPTPLLIDTDILSRIIGDTLEIAGAPASKKSICLNKAAARIAGANHNWGYLTGRGAPVVAESLARDLAVARRAAPRAAEEPAATEMTRNQGMEFVDLPVTPAEPGDFVGMPDIDPGAASPTGRLPRSELFERAAEMLQPPKAQDLASVMRDRGHRQEITRYIEDNLERVQEDLNSLAVTGRAWEKAGHRVRGLVAMDQDTAAGNREPNNATLRSILVDEIRALLGRHAEGVLALME